MPYRSHFFSPALWWSLPNLNTIQWWPFKNNEILSRYSAWAAQKWFWPDFDHQNSSEQKKFPRSAHHLSNSLDLMTVALHLITAKWFEMISDSEIQRIAKQKELFTEESLLDSLASLSLFWKFQEVRLSKAARHCFLCIVRSVPWTVGEHLENLNTSALWIGRSTKNFWGLSLFSRD